MEIIEKMPDFDLGFVEGPVEMKDLPSHYEVIPWQDDEIVLVLPKDHVLAKQYPESVPLDVFTQHQVIWREAGSGARIAVEKALLEAGIVAPVKRAEEITVTALDSEGRINKFTATGILAICLQHELDHLDGKVFVDYLSRLKRERIRKQLLKECRNDNAAATTDQAVAL
jgi:DNA-binding transcriptional LysR family regulator